MIEVEGADATTALPALIEQLNSIELYESETEPGSAVPPSV